MAPGRSAIQIDVAHFSGAGAAIPGPSQFYVAQGSGTVQATIVQNMHNYQVFKNCVAYCAGPQALANLLVALVAANGSGDANPAAPERAAHDPGCVHEWRSWTARRVAYHPRPYPGRGAVACASRRTKRRRITQ